MKRHATDVTAHSPNSLNQAPVADASASSLPEGFDLQPLETRTLLAAGFYAPAELSGSVTVQLVPLANVTAGTAETVTFGVPFTRGSLTQAQLANLRVLKNGVEIPAFVEQLTPWRSIDDPAIDGQSVRVARIQISYTFSTLNPENITVQWGGPARSLNVTTLQDPRLSWHSVTSGSFVAADNVEEPDVLPVLPKATLAKGILDSQVTPDVSGVAETRDDPTVMDSATFPGYTEYDYAEKNFFYTIINQNGSTGSAIDYKTAAGVECWLYDRPTAMYELYFRSGFATALREAVRATDFYYDHIDSSGFFTLKPGDPKYCYNEGLAYTYWLLGDNTIYSKIATVPNAFSGTVTRWTPQLSFWTERNTGDKLLSNEIAYEVTGNSSFKSTVQTIVSDLVYMQNGANGQLPANRIDGGLFHYGFQHDPSEVSSDYVIIASPWMSALIVDPMVRIYGVWEDNPQIPDFLVRMGNFEKIACQWDNPVGDFGGTTRYPDYLMLWNGQPDNDIPNGVDNRPGNGVQHAMDVGGIAAWATYFAELRGTPDASLRQLANDLYATYDLGVNSWTSASGGYAVSPGRRYTWEYKNSSSFAWAMTGTDPTGSAGLIQFSGLTYSVVENQPLATITVTRAHGSTGSVSVNYATSNGTATAGSDYTASSGTITFAAGQTSQTFTIPITNDTAVENMESVVLTLSNPTGGAALDSPSTAKLLIDSDDTTTLPVTQTFQQGVNGYNSTIDASISNQNGGNGSTTITGNQLSVYQLTGSNAYTMESLIRFADLGITTHATTNATVTTASLQLTADFGSAGSTIRGYYVSKTWSTDPGTNLGWLYSGSGKDWAVGGATGQGTDVIAGKSFVLPTVTGTQTVTVALDPAVVQSWIDDPNADQGILLVNETTNQVVRVDSSEYATASSRPKLSVSYTVSSGTSPGALQFSSALFNVGENQGTATVTVTRTGGSTGAVSVNYSTSDGSAVNGSDYTAASGTLTFAAGQTSQTFTVPILNDTVVESDETVNLTLSNPTGGAVLGSQATAAIVIADDDLALPGTLQFSAGTYSVNEPDGVATITVTRTGGSNVPVTVVYATADGTATAGNDYTAAGGTLSFAIGETSKTFTVPIINDTLVENPETVTLTLSGATGGATIGSPAAATLTIVSEDVGSTIAATYQQGVNGYTGTTDVAIANQYGGNGNTDYTGTYIRDVTTTTYGIEGLMKFGNLNIPAGSTVMSATLTLSISCWSPIPTIRGYYVLPSWTGTSGSGLGWLYRSTGQAWNTPGAIGQGSDVVAGKNFTLPGVKGNGNQTVTIGLDTSIVQGWINNPSSNQGFLFVDESVGPYLDINTSDNATVANRPILAITYNAAAPGSLQFDNAAYSVNENAGTATITVNRTGGSTGSVSVNYATSNGTATAGSDYTAASGTLTFADGETSKTFTVPITNDTAVESSETVNLTLSGPIGGATLGSQSTAVLTIQDDDNPGTLQFSSGTYSQAENGGAVTITVTRAGGSAGAVSVNYATSNGTATANSDYSPASGTLTFAAGQTSQTFTIPVLNDALVEGNETVNITLSSPTGGATLGTPASAVLTIVDDDIPGTLQFSSPTYSLMENGGSLTVTVTRTGGSSGAVSVNYATSNGSATAGSDYTAAIGTLNFANGDTSKTFTITVLDDSVYEGNETVNLTLSGPTGGATLGSQSTAVFTIMDNDSPPPTGSFTDISDSSGLTAIINQKYAEQPTWWMAGEHLVDLDGDGNLDLFIDAHTGGSIVCLGDGQGHFTRVTTGTWPDLEIHQMYDINNDGKVDLSATYGDGGGQWWINNSTPGHINFTATGITRDGNTSRAQVMMDFNGDGNVDWLRSEQPGLMIDYGDGKGNFAYNSVHFTIPGTTTNENANLIPGDFDGDGRTDLLILTGGGYETPETTGQTAYWHNNGNGTFTDMTASSGLPTSGTLVKGVGDYNQDGYLDLIAVTNKTMPPVIYINDGTGHFTLKSGAVSGISSSTMAYSAWGTAVTTDFDNDGIPDIIMDGRWYLKVLRGTGGGNFTYMDTAWGIKDVAPATVDEGLCFGDINNDGKVDVIGFDSTNDPKSLHVYRNDLSSSNWLNIRPVGLKGNAGAAGAKISIYAAGTSQLLSYEQVAQYDFQTATSYYGGSQTERHYGLGARTSVDVVVAFPSGHVVRVNNVTANQTLAVRDDLPGDATGDGAVTFADYVALANNFGGPGGWAQGDFNGDGKVTFADYVLLANNFGQSASLLSAALSAQTSSATLPSSATSALTSSSTLLSAVASAPAVSTAPTVSAISPSPLTRNVSAPVVNILAARRPGNAAALPSASPFHPAWPLRQAPLPPTTLGKLPPIVITDGLETVVSAWPQTDVTVSI